MIHGQEEVYDGQEHEGDPYNYEKVVEIDLTNDGYYENTRGQEVWENFVPRYWLNHLCLCCLSSRLLLVF
jgi:hypothetical protein